MYSGSLAEEGSIVGNSFLDLGCENFHPCRQVPEAVIMAWMNAADLHLIGFTNVAPAVWLRQWSSLYPALAGYDEDIYRALIRRHQTLTTVDFEQIGRWKDDARSEAKWKPNVASVAHDVWMQAAVELPREPHASDLPVFLDRWAERTSHYVYRSGKSSTQRFGLSRASTLLHFISGGRYPIFDSRVIAALTHLLGQAPEYTIRWYLGSLCQIIADMADCCGTKDHRTIDQALFCYGVFLSQLDPMPTPLRELAVTSHILPSP